MVRYLDCISANALFSQASISRQSWSQLHVQKLFHSLTFSHCNTIGGEAPSISGGSTSEDSLGKKAACRRCNPTQGT